MEVNKHNEIPIFEFSFSDTGNRLYVSADHIPTQPFAEMESIEKIKLIWKSQKWYDHLPDFEG